MTVQMQPKYKLFLENWTENVKMSISFTMRTVYVLFMTLPILKNTYFVSFKAVYNFKCADIANLVVTQVYEAYYWLQRIL